MPAGPVPYDEHAMLTLLAAGNQQAFATIYDHYWKKIYSVANIYLKDTGMAEDIVQDTFLRIWQMRSDLHAVHHFPAYLHAIARNLIISYFRKKTAAHNVDLEAIPATLLDTDWQPLQQLEHRDNEALLGRAISKLSPRQKQIYNLSREKNSTLKEVAHHLNISYDTARQYKSEALHLIRFFIKHNAVYLSLLSLLF